ncbi:MAG: hypothetical protein V5A30_10200 [Haloarculaceae archaeon]
MADSHAPRDCPHPYQKIALGRLQRHVSMSVRDIAAAVATEQGEYGTLAAVPVAELEAIERELRRRHIPELVERSYVRYDEDREVVNLLGRGTDAAVDVAADADCVVDLETVSEASITVDLSERTLERLHEAMLEREGLDREMSYDEVVRWLAETDR